MKNVIASSQVPANLAQLKALELRSEAAARRNHHDNDETASEDIKVVTFLEFSTQI